MAEESTISFNGGPEIPVGLFQEAASTVVRKAAEQQFPNLQEFFAEVDRREDEISEIRGEINDCFDSYCSSTSTNKEALKLAYKLFKAINKDKHRAEVMQFEYDKMSDLLLNKTDQLGLFEEPA